METLIFHGVIQDGIHKYSELYVPGRSEITQAPEDWPRALCKGSLNVGIRSDGYPAIFSVRGLPNQVSSLDTECFPCCFKIEQDQFQNNLITPTDAYPKRGSAQVWRASLEADRQPIACWVLRRYGSTLTTVLEILSEHHLRNTYGFKNGQPVSVALQSGAAV